MFNLWTLSLGTNLITGILLSYFLIFEGPPVIFTDWLFTVFVLVLTIFNFYMKTWERWIKKDSFLDLWLKIVKKRFEEKKRGYKDELTDELEEKE